VKTLHYALGGGLGHLVRARAFLESRGLARDAVVLTASRYADDPRVLGGIAHERVPDGFQHDRVALREHLEKRIAAIAPARVIVDTFPCGILGELGAIERAACWHLARRLRWDAYAPLTAFVGATVGATLVATPAAPVATEVAPTVARMAAPPRFERTFRLEPLADAHERFLREHSDAIVDLDLDEPAPPAPPIEGAYWVVVHSGPEAEVAELVAHAVERRAIERAAAPILVASPCAPRELPPDCFALDMHPAHALFARAERIVSAAGYNVMRQAAPYRHKHVVVPMPRRFDDQYERARRHG